MSARIRRSAAAALALVSVAACTSGHREPAGKTPTDNPRIAVPDPGGRASFAASTPTGASPTKAPTQAAGELRGQALPTNQWWSSALTGPLSQPMWARPLAVQATAGGLQVSSAAPVASANTVATPFKPAVTAGGPIKSLQVAGFGAFHVLLRAKLRDGGTVEATLVQGSPVLYLRFTGTAPSLTSPQPTIDGSVARVTTAGQRWDLLSGGGGWRQDGGKLTAPDARDGRVAIARVPDGVHQSDWDSAVARAAGDPVVRTTATMAYDRKAGTVTQTLTAERESGKAGVWALLPHQQAGLDRSGIRRLDGGYPDPLGRLSLVEASTVRVGLRMPGLLTAAPSVPLPGPARDAVIANLDRDLAAKPGAGGSYFGLKELGRLSTIAQVAHGVGAEAQRRHALDRLRPQLVDWLTYRGDKDGRYFAYDRKWGGFIAFPAEFGSNDYNDHHLQYGYLVRAAATLAAADPGFRHDYGGAVDLIAREYCGSPSPPAAPTGAPGLPPLRVFNPYLGHSAASGFAPFADGNNQESSSEAVAAWEAVVRWGLAGNRQDLVTFRVTHYAMESATARMYWLGQSLSRPAGYAHRVAGIVWDAKIDYATFFDPKPESVEGIQLLPLTFGSLYRADPDGAAARTAGLDKAAGGRPRVWGDLFAADLAAADPRGALRRLDTGLSREDSTSRAVVRYYIEMLAAFGPPQLAVVVDSPYGMAFGGKDDPTLAVVNPTADRQTVTVRTGGRTVATVPVDPGQAVTRGR